MMTALRIAGWTNLAIGLLHIAARPWERRMSYWVGIGPDMVGLVEDELNREGLTLGTLAKPPRLPTLETMFAPKNTFAKKAA